MSILPEKNVVGKTKINRSVLESDDWKAAKEHFDKGAADRVIERLWFEKKSADLKAFFQNPSDVVFITVPSTTRKNVVPIRLAEKLSKEFDAKYVVGDEHYIPVHGRQSKNIPRLQRPFHRRVYVSENREALREAVAGNRWSWLMTC